MKTLLVFLATFSYLSSSFAEDIGCNTSLTPFGYVTPVFDMKKILLAESYIKQTCPQYVSTNGAVVYVREMSTIRSVELSDKSKEFILECEKAGSKRAKQ